MRGVLGIQLTGTNALGGHGGFADGVDVFGTLGFEDLLGAIQLVIGVRMRGDETVALLELLLVALGFDLRNAETDGPAAALTQIMLPFKRDVPSLGYAMGGLTLDVLGLR